MESKQLICPQCSSTSLLIKYEATYVYSYVIDANAPGIKNDEEFLPFLYDDREQTNTMQYLECSKCKAKFPCYFNQWDSHIGVKELQDAIGNGMNQIV